MNIQEIKEKIVFISIGIGIALLWVLFSVITGFDWYAFISNPVVLSIGLFLLVPFSFFLADALWGDK
jgi:hypothetical protein